MFDKPSIQKLIREINLDSKNKTSTTIDFRLECLLLQLVDNFFKRFPANKSKQETYLINKKKLYECSNVG